MGIGKRGTKLNNRPSVRHQSHNHPLRVFTSKEGDEIICSGCELEVLGKAFKCTKTECEYFLHKSCFDLPCEIDHKSHPNHPLTLLYSPLYGHSVYTCKACGEHGSAFTYHCSECAYDVHVGCAFIPEILERDDHEHPLTLLYCTPCKGNEDGMVFTCDVCEEVVSEDLWVYYCKECDYGTHVHSCTAYEDNESKKEEEDEEEEEGESSSIASRMKSLMKSQKEMAMMQLELDAMDAANSYVGSWETKRRYYW